MKALEAVEVGVLTFGFLWLAMLGLAVQVGFQTMWSVVGTTAVYAPGLIIMMLWRKER